MNVKVEYNFDLPDENCEYQMYLNSLNAYLCLQEMSEKLRSIYKYENHDAKELELIERIRNDFYQILEENSVNLDY